MSMLVAWQQVDPSGMAVVLALTVRWTPDVSQSLTSARMCLPVQHRMDSMAVSRWIQTWSTVWMK